jgi:hypothetical protein
MGIQGERRWIIAPTAPPDPAAPNILAPRAPPTLVAYKSHLTLAGKKYTPQELHYCPLLYLRIESCVIRS